MGNSSLDVEKFMGTKAALLKIFSMCYVALKQSGSTWTAAAAAIFNICNSNCNSSIQHYYWLSFPELQLQQLSVILNQAGFTWTSSATVTATTPYQSCNCNSNCNSSIQHYYWVSFTELHLPRQLQQQLQQLYVTLKQAGFTWTASATTIVTAHTKAASATATATNSLIPKLLLQ